MSYVLFENPSPGALDSCPEYWQNFINSFPSDDEDPFGDTRSKRIRQVFRDEYKGSMTRGTNRDFRVSFPNKKYAMLFVLKWR